MSLKSFVNEELDTLCFFYVDVLEGGLAEDSKIVKYLRDEYKFEILIRFFNLSQQLKIRNIKNEIDRYTKLFNMLILQYVIAKYENVEKFCNLKMDHNEFGKPKLENRDYQFNISDEEGVVSIAVGFDGKFTDCEIGVDLANPEDIERFKLDHLEDFYNKDFKDIYGKGEIEMIDTVFPHLEYDERLLLLSETWALKESYCKYLGVGITGGLEKYEFHKLPKMYSTNVERVKVGGNTFTVIGDSFTFGEVEGYEAKNVCFHIPERRIICSVFSHYEKLRVIKIDGLELIKHFSVQ